MTVIIKDEENTCKNPIVGANSQNVFTSPRPRQSDEPGSSTEFESELVSKYLPSMLHAPFIDVLHRKLYYAN